MSIDQKTSVVRNLPQRSIMVSRSFDAPVELVWRAYTEPELLDQWWGPAPWRAVTKRHDFREGGQWLYAMVGPNGERHWGFMNFSAIKLHVSFEVEDGFCDENGTVNPDFAVATGTNVFTATGTGTHVAFTLHYATEEQLMQIVEMGFEAGITQCLDQLDELLRKIS